MNTSIITIVEDRDMHNSLIYGTLNYPRNLERAELFQLDVYVYGIYLFILNTRRACSFQQNIDNGSVVTCHTFKEIGYYCKTGIERMY